MTQTKYIVILDASTTRVIFTTCEHNPTDDMDIAVIEEMDRLGLSQDECVWQEINQDTEIEIAYPLQMSAIKYN